MRHLEEGSCIVPTRLLAYKLARFPLYRQHSLKRLESLLHGGAMPFAWGIIQGKHHVL